MVCGDAVPGLAGQARVSRACSPGVRTPIEQDIPLLAPGLTVPPAHPGDPGYPPPPPSLTSTPCGPERPAAASHCPPWLGPGLPVPAASQGSLEGSVKCRMSLSPRALLADTSVFAGLPRPARGPRDHTFQNPLLSLSLLSLLPQPEGKHRPCPAASCRPLGPWAQTGGLAAHCGPRAQPWILRQAPGGRGQRGPNGAWLCPCFPLGSPLLWGTPSPLPFPVAQAPL